MKKLNSLEFYSSDDFNKIFNYFILEFDEGFRYNNIVLNIYKRISCIDKLIGFVGRIFSCKSTKPKYVFMGTKYKDLILSLERDDVLIIGGFKQLVFCLINRKKYFYIGYLYSYLNSYFIKKSDRNHVLANEIYKFLYKFSPSHIVFINDSLPMERAIILASQRMNINTICIQHGVFQSSNTSLLDGVFVDLMLVYDDHHKLMYKDFINQKSIVLGYHSNIVKINNYVSYSIPNKRVCILGQPYFDYYSDLENNYINTISKLISVLENNDIAYCYKPHPSEKKGNYLRNIKNKLYTKKLIDAFRDFDVFISFTSTALLEASLHNRVAIQLTDEWLKCDNFELLGYSYSVEINNQSVLIDRILSAKPIKNDVIFQMSCYSIKERFLRSIAEEWS